MNNVVTFFFVMILLIPNKSAAQFFSADPVGDGFKMNLYGKPITGPVIGGIDGNVEINLRRTDHNDHSLIRFNANSLETVIGVPQSMWELGLRGRDELGIYYTDGDPGSTATAAAITFKNSSSIPYASFGAPNYLARITVLNTLHGKKGIHSTASGIGIFGESTADTPGSASGPGVYGKSLWKAGVLGEGENGYGVQGNSTGNHGVYGTSTAKSGVYGFSSVDHGIFGKSTSNVSAAIWGEGLIYGVRASGEAWAVYGDGVGQHGDGVRGISENRYGVSGKTGNEDSYAGYFEGDVIASGHLHHPSDRKLKKNEQKLTSCLQIIHQLKPKTYEYDRIAYADMQLPKGKRCGLIAQEVEQVLPNLIKETTHFEYDRKNPHLGAINEVKFKAINYTELIPVLIAAIQEQSELIQTVQNNLAVLKKENALLQAQIN